MKKIVEEISKCLGVSFWGFHVPKIISKLGIFLIEKIYLFFGKEPFFNIKRYYSIISSRYFDISKIKQLGYKQKYSLNQGIKETITFYKKEGFL